MDVRGDGCGGMQVCGVSGDRAGWEGVVIAVGVGRWKVWRVRGRE